MDPDCYVLSKLASWRRDEGGLGGRPHTRGNGRWGGNHTYLLRGKLCKGGERGSYGARGR